MLSWILSGLPAAVFAGLLLAAALMPIVGPLQAGKVAAVAVLGAVACWALLIPRWASRRMLARLSLSEDPRLKESWARAVAGRGPRWPEPKILLWRTAAPCLLAWRQRMSPPVLLVSEGWLFLMGEDAFRDACRRADVAWSSPRLCGRTQAAFTLPLLMQAVPASFWAFSYLQGSESSRRQTLSPAAVAAGAVLRLWVHWILNRAWGRGMPDEVPGSGPPVRPGSAALSPDSAGRLEPGLSVWTALLSLGGHGDGPGAVRADMKSTLSWLPAQRQVR
jgi:hypothetical protein